MTKSRGRNVQRNPQHNPQGVIHAQQTTIYKGQLPPPDMLERFEQIQPGFTDRLLKMVEGESVFKREQDRRMFTAAKATSIMGIIFAFLSVIVVSAVAVYAIFKGFGTAAAGIMGTSVVGVIIAFLQRRRRNTEENKRKA